MMQEAHNDRRESILALRWALEHTHDASLSAADWLARDLSPDHHSAEALLNDRTVPLGILKRCKQAYKTMRVVGETKDDRRVGARLYAASIAAALVHHGERITRQSDAALQRAFGNLVEDRRMPDRLRALGGRAMCVISGQVDPHIDGHAAGSAPPVNGASKRAAAPQADEPDDFIRLADGQDD